MQTGNIVLEMKIVQSIMEKQLRCRAMCSFSLIYFLYLIKFLSSKLPRLSTKWIKIVLNETNKQKYPSAILSLLAEKLQSLLPSWGYMKLYAYKNHRVSQNKKQIFIYANKVNELQDLKKECWPWEESLTVPQVYLALRNSLKEMWGDRITKTILRVHGVYKT